MGPRRAARRRRPALEAVERARAPAHAAVGRRGDAGTAAERARAPARAEIQALRALAVAIVVAYHLWPRAVPGGFVGVDVFFAISGFLVTAQLARDVERRGRPSTWGFWARRARRLLPAALLTLLACAVATLLLVPPVHRQQFIAEIGASAAYVQNWQLAGDAVDYFAQDNRPSPVQHFWSLSVEEQLYLVWPLLIGLAALVARSRAAIATALAAVTGLSLGYAIAATAADPAVAYLATPTRAWEFGAGGLLALLGATVRSAPAARARWHRRLRWWLVDRCCAVLSWLGLGAIAYAALAFDATTAIPGAAALVPVLGTLAVIHAGLPAARWAPSSTLRLRPAQFVGDVSYGVYLWHWPLLVLAPYALAAAGDVRVDATLQKLAVVALTLLLAWATKVLVEDPVRRSAWLSTRPRLTFAFGGAATAVLAVLLVGGTTHVQAQIRAAEREAVRVVARAPACFGAAARDVPSCAGRAPARTVVPRPVAAHAERNWPCRRPLRQEGGVSVCEFGVPARRATRTVALVGDSHASHWRAPLDAVARELGWHGLSIARTSCPYSLAEKRMPEPTRSRCERWLRALPALLRRHPEVDTLFVAALAGGALDAPADASGHAAKVAGFETAWRALPASVRHIVVIRDTPRMTPATAECVERAIAAGRAADGACAVARRLALPVDPEVVAARGPAGRARGAEVVDLTSVLCSARSCFPVIGGALVFKDTHHFTRVFARTLGAPLGRAVRRVAGDW